MIKIEEIDFNNISGDFIKAKDLKKNMKNMVEPYLETLKEDGYFEGCKKKKIYYKVFLLENPKANIFISHGHREFIERYNEIIYYFLKEGYSVFIMEHRGHGRSDHLGKDKSQIHVEKFNYYLDDIKIFIDKIVIKKTENKPLFLFAHSMGGGIGAGFLEKYPEIFKCAVLHAPMLKINTGNIPSLAAYILSRIMKILHKEMNYIPGQKPYSGQKKDHNKAADCIERYRYTYNNILENQLFQYGGSSINWYLESSRAIKKIIEKKNASKVKIPVLLMQPENDYYVIAQSHNKFAKYAENCTLMRIKNSKHESMNENDHIAFPVFNAVFQFFNDNC